MSINQPERRYASWYLALIIVVFSTLIGAVLTELGLRFFWHNPFRHETPDRVLRLRIEHALTDHVLDRSLIDSKTPTVRFRTDQRSYILPSRRFGSPDATIAFIGGSTTQCMAVQEDLRFPARVSYLLENKGLKVNTLNASKWGSTTHDALNVLLNHVVQDRPDMIVLMEAVNDVGVLAAHKSYQSRMSGTESLFDAARLFMQKASSISYSIGLLRKVATTDKVRAAEIGRKPAHELMQTVSVPRDEYDKRLRAFVGVARAFRIQPILMTQPLSKIRNDLTPAWADPRNQEVFNDIIRKVGTDEKIMVIDLVQYLISNLKDWDRPTGIFYDGMHVNDHGSEIYARYIAEQLYDVLRHRIKEGGRLSGSA